VADEASFCATCGTQVADPHTSTVVLHPAEGDEFVRRVRMVFSGDYEIEEEVGRGGMSVVYRATELALQRQVALKVLLPELGLTAKAAERFKREARLAAELDHPNITPVYRAGQTGGILHIVMKFVDGRPLDSILDRQGPLPVPVVLAVLRAATRALSYAHERGIVHRDTKSGNILVDRDGRIMVCDFGVALRVTDLTLTAAGTIIGTPAYMSPEQCAGQRALPQSDQYSLGIVAFQMLTGHAPFHADNLAAMMQHHFLTPVPDLRPTRDDLPPALVDIVERALAKDPAQRFATTQDMLVAIGAIPYAEEHRRFSSQALRELAGGNPVEPVTARPATEGRTLVEGPLPLPRPKTRRRWWIAGAGISAGLAAVVLTSRGPRDAGTAANPPESGGMPAVAAAAGVPGSTAAVPTLAPAPRAAPAPSGKLRLLTAPPDAEIRVDGRRVSVGSVFDLKVTAGPRRVEVRAAGYQTFDTVVVVAPDATLSLGRVVLAPQAARE